MRKKGYKGRIEKRVLGKCEGICRTYDAIQTVYADILQQRADVQLIRCNVLLEGLPEGEYTSDFVCIKTDGDFIQKSNIEINGIKVFITSMKIKGMEQLLSVSSFGTHMISDNIMCRLHQPAYLIGMLAKRTDIVSGYDEDLLHQIISISFCAKPSIKAI